MHVCIALSYGRFTLARSLNLTVIALCYLDQVRVPRLLSDL